MTTHNPNLYDSVKDDVASPFQEAPRFQALLAAIIDALQLMEDDVGDMILGLALNGAGSEWGRRVWGDLFDEPSGGLSAAEHVRVIKAKAIALRSDGTPTALALLIKALYPGATYSIFNLESNAALIQVQLDGPPSDEMSARTLRLIRLAKPAGVRVDAVWYTAPPFGFDGDDSAEGYDTGSYASLFGA